MIVTKFTLHAFVLGFLALVYAKPYNIKCKPCFSIIPTLQAIRNKLYWKA